MGLPRVVKFASLDASGTAQSDVEKQPGPRLEKHKQEFLRILKKFGAENPRLYGPSTDGQDSDITGLYLLVDGKEDLRVEDLGRVRRLVSDLIEAGVTIRTPVALPAETRRRFFRCRSLSERIIYHGLRRPCLQV